MVVRCSRYSAPTSKIPRASTGPPSPRCSPLRPAYEAELPARPAPVAPVGVIPGAAGGAGTEDDAGGDADAGEQETDRRPQIDQPPALAASARRRDRVA